jgi:hypothetical protein
VILWAAVVLALAAALVSAVLLARRDRAHWPVAASLAMGLVIDLTVGHRGAWGIARALAGVSRPSIHAPVLWHLSQALVTAWPAGLAACALAVFVRTPSGRVRTRWAALALVPWATLQVSLLASGPHTPEGVQRLLTAHEVVALVVGAVAAIVGWRRDEDWTWPHAAVLWLLGVELAVVMLGPFRTSVYEKWDLARVAYALCFVVLAVMQVIAHRRRRVGS